MNLKDLARTAKPKHRTPLSVTQRRHGAVTVFEFTGDLDLKSLPTAKKAIADLDMHKEPPRVVIDLAAVEFIDSSGLGWFIGTLKHLRERRGDLRLARLNAYMLGIVKLINMHMIIDLHESVEAALESF